MNNLRNCAECGRLFVFVNRNICPACIEKEEEMYEKVRKYLKENPGVPIQEVSEKTGVPEEKIIRFLREGRLEATSVAGGLTCESCGRPIKMGFLCDSCREQVAREMKEIAGSSKLAARKEKERRGRGMFIADRIRSEQERK